VSDREKSGIHFVRYSGQVFIDFIESVQNEVPNVGCRILDKPLDPPLFARWSLLPLHFSHYPAASIKSALEIHFVAKVVHLGL
jgi:hypothetical protein